MLLLKWPSRVLLFFPACYTALPVWPAVKKLSNSGFFALSPSLSYSQLPTLLYPISDSPTSHHKEQHRRGTFSLKISSDGPHWRRRGSFTLCILFFLEGTSVAVITRSTNSYIMCAMESSINLQLHKS